MMETHHGLPKPRHAYVHIPQPGRRGVLVHNHQIPNGAAPSGVAGGGMGYGHGYGYGAVGGGFYPGVYPMTSHIAPLYYGPNVSSSLYSRGYYNYPAYSYPSHSYYSPYASYGAGVGMYANYYHPYQRSYYYPPAVAAPAYSYAYPAAVMPTTTTTTYTLANSHVPSAAPLHRPQNTARDHVQLENRRIATERGAYLPHGIRPANAQSDQPFWCKERSGEWHLRTLYQIENECHPGFWTQDPETGYVSFQRQ